MERENCPKRCAFQKIGLSNMSSAEQKTPSVEQKTPSVEQKTPKVRGIHDVNIRSQKVPGIRSVTNVDTRVDGAETRVS
jgi:hypothetical protein